MGLGESGIGVPSYQEGLSEFDDFGSVGPHSGEVVSAFSEFCHERFILCVLKDGLLVKEADETLFLENDIRGTYCVGMKINLKYCSSGFFPSAFRAAIHCSSR